MLYLVPHPLKLMGIHCTMLTIEGGGEAQNGIGSSATSCQYSSTRLRITEMIELMEEGSFWKVCTPSGYCEWI